MKKQYIQYSELLKRQQHLNRLKAQGFKLIYSKSRFKVVCGVGCLVVAVIPNGTAPFMLPLGLGLLGIGFNDIQRFKENLKFKVWLKLDSYGGVTSSINTKFKRGAKKWNIYRY